MADAAAIIEAAGSRFASLELIGRGSFGDVYKGYLHFFQFPVGLLILETKYFVVKCAAEGKKHDNSCNFQAVSRLLTYPSSRSYQ